MKADAIKNLLSFGRYAFRQDQTFGKVASSTFSIRQILGVAHAVHDTRFWPITQIMTASSLRMQSDQR
jgi:hypothetical protein